MPIRRFARQLGKTFARVSCDALWQESHRGCVSCPPCSLFSFCSRSLSFSESGTAKEIFSCRCLLYRAPDPALVDHQHSNEATIVAFQTKSGEEQKKKKKKQNQKKKGESCEEGLASNNSNNAHLHRSFKLNNINTVVLHFFSAFFKTILPQSSQ